MRDTGRKKALAIHTAFVAPATQRHFATVDEVQAYLDRLVRKSVWFRRRYAAIASVGVVAKPVYTSSKDFESISGRFSQTIFPVIYLPTMAGSLFEPPENAWTELLVWHLVAHHCAADSAHTRRWARVWLQLVKHFMGASAARALRLLFRNHRMHYFRRELTEDQRLAARERLAANRKTSR